MANLNQTDLVPDFEAISGISEFAGMPICYYDIISNNLDTCTFFVLFEENHRPVGLPDNLLIRFEKQRDGNPLLATAALQQLAHLEAPYLVPKVWGSGETQAGDGTKLSYMLSQFHPDTCTLESVWEDLGQDEQLSLMKDVVDAMAQFQSICLTNLSDEAKEILKNTPFDPTTMGPVTRVGGPEFGYFHDFSSFLKTTLEPGKAKYDIWIKHDGTVVIQVHSPDEIGIGFAVTELDLLVKTSVLCHNDMEPRNLLVRKVPGEVEPKYELVAIINWRMAGFFPFAFEVGRKDTCLGLQNHSWSWYDLFRNLTGQAFLTGTSGNAIRSKLIRALFFTDRTRKLGNSLNVGNRVQILWHEKERLVLSSLAEKGFVKRKNAEGMGPSTPVDTAELEQEALRELGYI
ncbi:hypothetical protein EsH8_IV_001210 [Colletotrichum jinshuiense]